MNLNKKSKLSYSHEHALHILIIVIVVEKLIPMYTEFLLQTKIKQQRSQASSCRIRKSPYFPVYSLKSTITSSTFAFSGPILLHCTT